jgi:hypothetical protein
MGKMYIEAVKKYLNYRGVSAPFFIFVGDNQYLSVKNNFLSLKIVQMSDFCTDKDKAPNMDDFLSFLKNFAAKAKDKEKNLLIVGLGEYLALCGKESALKILSGLRDLSLTNIKIVLLLRGLSTLIGDLRGNDPRFDENRRFIIVDNAACHLSFTVVGSNMELRAIDGFKDMLKELENGRRGNILVNTSIIDQSQSLFTIHKINSAYDGIKLSCVEFNLPKTCGNDALWAQLLSEINQNNGSLEDAFRSGGLNVNFENNVYAQISNGSDYKKWLYFIALKTNAAALNNSYLRFVVDKTDAFDDFKTNILNAIIEIPHSDNRFRKFYDERKILVEKCNEADIKEFVFHNKQDIDESIYRLTDNTKTEREEIIAWVSKNRKISEIEEIYPDLAAYQKPYFFRLSQDDEMARLLTQYFDAYKRQKLSNKLEPEFLDRVSALAYERKYNQLPTREQIIDALNKDNAYLYWLDALGVEYLAFIENLAHKLGLSININISRAQLPTITSINRGFFDDWGGDKGKNNDLDEVKHKDKGGYNFTDEQAPIHLAKELDIIKEALEKAAAELASRRYKKFLIASDHGASRLAVLRRKEEKYETDTKGEHSGRCCKLFKAYDLPFAAEENGYLVLADYGRFKGGRAANAEVHGGASLEEVIVPVIELSLKDETIKVKLTEKTMMIDFQKGIEIELIFNSPVKDVYIDLNGNRYEAQKIDSKRHKVHLADIKRAGGYQANVFAGGSLIGQIDFKAQGRSAKLNEGFDKLF